MSAGALAMRQRAAEGHWFNLEDRINIIKRLERMVESGQIDKSALLAVQNMQSPVEVISTREHPVFEYKKGLLPPPRTLKTFSLGTQFSLGRARWTTDDASIFSVADGKRLASTPPPNATYYESLRMAKIQKAALQTPTVAGYRLLPELTPGRAMMWGTIIAMWGTAALVVTAARQMGIEDAKDANGKLKGAFAPMVAGLQARLAPLRRDMSVAAAAGTMREDASGSQLAQLLRARLAPH